jgi:hypothetical protein
MGLMGHMGLMGPMGFADAFDFNPISPIGHISPIRPIARYFKRSDQSRLLFSQSPPNVKKRAIPDGNWLSVLTPAKF